jgi:5'-deoxynucleotidase YfbR-like HD superfamily hydrolase
MENRIGDWIETYIGTKFYPLDPLPEEVYLENIAHGLSLMCRFNGQSKRFFSVAQHSINVMKEIGKLTRNENRSKSIKLQLLGLFHDASECLGISDICSPAKKHMPEYRAIESNIQNAVWNRFNLEHSAEEYEIVHLVDSAMAAYEARDLMRCDHWDLSNSYLIECDKKETSHIDLNYKNMEEVENDFLRLAQSLLKEYYEEDNLL